MDANYNVFIVDNDSTTRMLLQHMLSNHFIVEAFESGEACLERAEQKLPNLFLLDVDLPGINGYEACRMIKDTPEWKNIPVIFLSAHNTPQDAWEGYDAGGQDYIAKPFDVCELYRKLEIVHHLEEERVALNEQVKSSDELATVILTNLDEYSTLIGFLRILNECTEYQDVVNAVMEVIRVFHLEGVIQIRMRNLERTYSKAGVDWPLEVAVINNVRTLDRVFTFNTRASYNFDHITILITNMPVEDRELCGRIRDNLAIVAESAEAKLIALQNIFDKLKMQDELHDLLQEIEQTVLSYSKNYEEARVKGSIHTNRLIDDLLATIAHVGLSEQQEEQILGMVKDRTYELVDLYDIAGATQATLAKLSNKLEDILKVTDSAKSRRFTELGGVQIH